MKKMATNFQEHLENIMIRYYYLFVLLSSSSSSYLELRSDLRRKLAVLELPLWLPGRLLLPCLNITLVSRTLSILAKGLQTGIEQQGSESDQNSDIPNIHIERNNDPIKHVNVIILIW